MAIKIQPLTKKQLSEIVECYATVFPDWQLLDGNRLERTFGPVVQHIGFEALRGGAYRPMGAIWALPLPTVAMLHQFLDIKYVQILPRQHVRVWRDVVGAMEKQFCPSIRKPLELLEIKGLCEQQARTTTNDLCMLAILNAYIGEREKAFICCENMQSITTPMLAHLPEWEERHRNFCRELQKAIETGNERQFIDAASAKASPTSY